MFRTLIILIYFGCHTIHGHEIKLFQRCPSVVSMESFDVEQFLGKWYIIQVFSSINKCMTMNFDKTDEFKMKVTQQREFDVLKKLRIDYENAYTGNIRIDPSNPSDMEVKWSANPKTMDFKVVDTDYTTYALIYECQDFYIFSRLSFAILSRKRELNEDHIAEAQLKIFEAGVDSKKLKTVDQSDCISKEEEEPFDENLSQLSKDQVIQKLIN